MTELKAKAEQIAAILRRNDLNAVEADVDTSGDVVIMFNLVDNDTTPWHKAIICPAVGATPEAFVLLFNDWALKKRKEIAINLPSETVGRAIRVYGILDVMKALGPRKLQWA